MIFFKNWTSSSSVNTFIDYVMIEINRETRRGREESRDVELSEVLPSLPVHVVIYKGR